MRTIRQVGVALTWPVFGVSNPWLTHGIAVALTALALLASVWLGPVSDALPTLLFLTAVSLSGWCGGIRPALLSVALSFVMIDYFFEHPPDRLEISSLGTVFDLVTFLVVCVLIGSLNGQLREALRREQVARRTVEEALHARDEALAAVSHDLRTPLTTIKTSASSLRDPFIHLSEDTRVQLLANIEAEADRLGGFVEDSLALTRLEANPALNLEWNALGDVAAAVLDRSLPILGGRSILFDIPDTLPLARFDAGLLDQALTNLLENVARHTPPDAPIQVLGCADGPWLRLDLHDGGPGIPPAARERVFAKFERLRDAGTGTSAGLGLAIARAALHLQGGKLWVEDSPSLGGAKFVLLLPAHLAVEGTS